MRGNDSSSIRILFCVLNWGLGHATRSIPVINALLRNGCHVELASDGGAALVLGKTFPDCVLHQLPGYNVRYPSRFFFVNAITQGHRIPRAMRREHARVRRILKERSFDLIISDNRYGCYHDAIRSVLITHQLRNLTGIPVVNGVVEITINRYLKHFGEIWIPDMPGRALSGKLTDIQSEEVRFIGYLSDQEPQPLHKGYDVAAILSGPEPQRGLLEQEVRQQLEFFDGHCALVRGIFDDAGTRENTRIEVIPSMTRGEINDLLNSTKVVVCRSGYSSLMDLLRVGTKAILIPTPGQPEQKYLANRLSEHPQFLVQKQGEVDIHAGVKALSMRDPVAPLDQDSGLLEEAIDHILQVSSRRPRS
jgi:UDP-N-acetylglucosamine transferase subunit ALG13